MSGIPWWTTDIGGFMEGDIRTDYFKELIVRWFQYGVFCPLFRLHGVRLPLNGLYGAQSSGADNEVWSFGEHGLRDHPQAAFPARAAQTLPARCSTRPRTSTARRPCARCIYDFPADAAAANLADEFMLGPDLLVAPVTEQGATSRTVYLPAGADVGKCLDG